VLLALRGNHQDETDPVPAGCQKDLSP